MRRSRLFPPLVATFALVVAGCASSGAGGTDEAAGGASGVTVEVNNDLVPPAQITVFIVPETGTRRRLGTVPQGGQRSFSFDPRVPSMQFRLLAEATGGSNSQSNPFPLAGASRVQWDVSNPNPRVGGAP